MAGRIREQLKSHGGVACATAAQRTVMGENRYILGSCALEHPFDPSVVVRLLSALNIVQRLPKPPRIRAGVSAGQMILLALMD